MHVLDAPAATDYWVGFDLKYEYNFQDVVDKEVKTLLELKADYKKLSGVDLAGGSDGKKGGKGGKSSKGSEVKVEKQETKTNGPAEGADAGTGRDVKKITR